MKIRTEHIRETVREFSFTESAESFPVLMDMVASGECRFNGPVKAELAVVREMDHYRIDGSVTVSVQLECSRCLCSFERVIFSRFTIFFREGVIACEDEDEIELEERDLVSAFFSGDEIDLAPEISGQIALDIPLKPLCSHSCKGLCPLCGVDLNTQTCSCSQEPVNIKFAALKDFKVRP